MEEKTYNKLLVIYKEFKTFFESESMLLFREPTCLEGLKKLIAKEKLIAKKKV